MADAGQIIIDLVLNEDFEAARKALAKFASEAKTAFSSVNQTLKSVDAGTLFDPSTAVKNIKTLQVALNSLLSATKGKELLPDAEAQVARLRTAIATLKTSLEKGIAPQGPIFPDLEPTEAALRKVGAAQEAAIRENIKFDDSLKLKNAGINELTTAERKIQSYGKAASAAITENESLNKSQEHSGNVFKRFADGLGAADDKLKEYGFSIRGVSILLGAGLTTGVVAVIRILEKLIPALLALVAADQELARQTELTFGAGSQETIRGFAQAESDVLGTSRDAIQGLVDSYGVLAIRLGVTGEGIKQVAIPLAQLADIVSRTTPGVTNLAEAQTLLQAAIKGDIEAIHQLGFTSAEFGDIAKKKFGLAVDQLDDIQRAAILATAGLDLAKQKLESIKPKNAGLQEFSHLLDVIKHDTAVVFGFFEEEIGNAASAAIFSFVLLEKEVDQAFNGIIKGANLAIRALNALNPFKDIPQIPEIPVPDPAAAAGYDNAGKAAKGLSSSVDDAKNSTNAFIDAENRQKAALANSAAFIEQLAAAHDNLAKTIGDSEISVNTAEVALSRAIADGADRISAAQKDIADAYKERNKAIGEANANLADVEKQTAKDNAEAAKNLVTVQKEAAKAIKEAEISLKEVRKDAAKNITDAEKNLAEVRKDSAQAILDANDRYAKSIDEINKRVENAQKKVLDVQQSISDELEKLTKKNQDAVRAVIDAEASLNDVRKSAAERIAEADRKLAILDGRRFAQLSKLNNVALRAVAGQEALAKARKELADAIEEGQKRITEAEKKEAEARQKVIDSGVEINKAQEEGNKKLLEAQAELVRIQEQALKDIQRADREHAEAIIKANDDVIKARQKLADTIIKANEKIADAQKKLKETIETSDQKVIDASNHLKDVLIESAKKVQDAQDKLKDAIITANDKIADAQRRVTAAQVDSARAITDAQVQLTIANRAAESAIHAAESAYIKLQASVAPTKKGIQDIETEALRLKAIFDATKLDPLNPRPLPIVPISFFAAGGDVRRGRTIIVGERGPELFTPNSDGHITSNSDLKNQSGATYTVNVYTNREDPDVVAARVASRLGAKSTR